MSGGFTQSQLNLSPEEKRAFGQLFKQADTQGLNVVTGEVAVDFFKRTKLDSTVLGEIWQIADTENRGLLTPAEFSVVLRLIGHCQNGRSPSYELALQPGPLPRFSGLSIGGERTSSPAPAPAAAPIPAQMSGSAPIRVPPLPSEKVTEYSGMFEKAGARDGFLSGDVARSVFERARLPNEALGQIWGLADVSGRGALNPTEFVVAMHLINSMRNGAMRSLPQTLPQGLWDAAARRGPAVSTAAMPRQFTGQQRTASPLSRQQPQQFASPPISTQTTGQASDWLISPQEKSMFDRSFDMLDAGKRGYVTGDQAVTFFSNSGLSEELLANIWDLADINSEGQLSRDEFAVAMYLIRQQRSRTDGRGDLPSTLPPRLIPPSMRQTVVAPSQTTAPAFDNKAFATPQPKGAAEDLFGLDALAEEPAPVPAFASPGPASPQSPPRAAPQNTQRAPVSGMKPFIPTSTFGQGLQPQQQGFPTTGPQTTQRGPPTAANDDLLGDNDPEVSSKLTKETTELANMSNQVGTLRNQMQEVHTKKGNTEQELSAQAAQRKELETRLAQFRTQYEQEIREVKGLEDRLNTTRAENKKISSELAMVEGAHQDLQSKHKEMSTALEADQKENASLKDRLRILNEEVAQLKPALEKLRNDARQQKGMVAINKKQVTTSESERDKLKTEQSTLQKEAAEREMADKEAANVAAPAPASMPAAREIASPGVVSPALSTSSRNSMNPFFRAKSPQQANEHMSPSVFATGAGAAAVGAAAGYTGHNAFDSFFGPSDHDASAEQQQHAENTGMSERSTEVSSAQTPVTGEAARSGTPVTQASEPPAPPASRQITSAALPLRPQALQEPSFASSVRSLAPESERASEISTPIRAAGFSDETQTNDTTEHMQETIAPDAEASAIPGAFPGEEDVSSKAPTDSSVTSDVAKDTSLGEDLTNKSNPFAGASGGPSANRSHDDFDSAFAGTEVSSSGAATGSRGFDDAFATGASSATANKSKSEFPPIQDVQQDEDSSDDEGFEDNFSPGASTSQAAHDRSGLATAAAAATGAGLGAGATGAAASSSKAREAEAYRLPDAGADSSPPPYNQTSTLSEQSREGRGSNQFPQQYGGLLPSREIVESPPHEPVQDSSAMLNAYGSPSSSAVVSPPTTSSGPAGAATMVSNVAGATTATKPVASAPKDDFDDAFDDLDDAKEGDDTDGFGSSAEHEFNPTFDSPAPPSFASRSGASAFHTPSVSNQSNTTITRNADGFSSSEPGAASSSTFSTSNFGTSSTSVVPQSTNATTTGSHDWDSIFAGLDGNTSESTANGSASKSPFDLPTLNTASNSSSTAAAPITTSTSAAKIQSPQPRSGASLASPVAPPLARAISQGTEHDDPILKSLTGMGFPRDQALKALEKYDYNLGAAANYLSSKSKK